MVCIILVRGRLQTLTLGDGGVEAEKLSDGYANRGEGERGAEPG